MEQNCWCRGEVGSQGIQQLNHIGFGVKAVNLPRNLQKRRMRNCGYYFPQVLLLTIVAAKTRRPCSNGICDFADVTRPQPVIENVACASIETVYPLPWHTRKQKLGSRVELSQQVDFEKGPK